MLSHHLLHQENYPGGAMKSILKKTSLAITFTGFFYGTTTAQDQSHAQGKGEASIELSYYKKSDASKIVVAIIKAKNKDGKFVPAINEDDNVKKVVAFL